MSSIAVKDLQHNDGSHGKPFWTAIHGKVYDITDFVRKHPGGDIINLAAGKEAATLFESHHPSDKMESVLAVLKGKSKFVGLLEGKPEPADAGFYSTVSKRVQAELSRLKLNRHDYQFITLVESILVIATFFVCCYLKGVYDSFLAAVIAGVMVGRLGFLMHMGNHAGVSKSPLINMGVGLLMDLMGGSSYIWQREHQVAHHMEPNVPKSDNDCTIADPILRMHPSLRRRWWHRAQAVVAFFGMTIGLIKWVFSDIQNFFDGVVGSQKLTPGTKDWVTMIVFKGSHFLLHFALPLYYGMSFGRTVFLWYIVMAVGGLYLENIFIVNHIQPNMQDPDLDSHWAVKQVVTTADWCGGSPIANFVSGGLNHQIEHHLFPNISHYLYPKIAPIVKKTCEEYKLPYHNFKSYSSAWLSCYGYLHTLGHSL